MNLAQWGLSVRGLTRDFQAQGLLPETCSLTTCIPLEHQVYQFRGHFKNFYGVESVSLGALKSSLLNKLHVFQCVGKLSYPYIGRYDFDVILKKNEELSDSWARMCIWNTSS